MSQNIAHTCLTKEEFDILIKDHTSRYDLEKKLDRCQFCADAFEGYQIIDAQKRNDFLGQKINVPQPIKYMRLLKIAAALLIGICLANALFDKETKHTTSELVAQYAPNENITDQYIVRGEAIPVQQKEVIEAFDAKDYEKCSQLLTQMPATQLKPYFRLIRAISLFELNHLDAAQKDFDALEGKTPFWDDKVHFYKVLIALKNENIETAKKQLNSIMQDPENDYYTQAIDLLQKL